MRREPHPHLEGFDIFRRRIDLEADEHPAQRRGHGPVENGERLAGRGPFRGQRRKQIGKLRRARVEDRRRGRLRRAAAVENEVGRVGLGEQAGERPVALGVVEIRCVRRLLAQARLPLENWPPEPFAPRRSPPKRYTPSLLPNPLP